MRYVTLYLFFVLFTVYMPAEQTNYVMHRFQKRKRWIALLQIFLTPMSSAKAPINWQWSTICAVWMTRTWMSSAFVMQHTCTTTLRLLQPTGRWIPTTRALANKSAKRVAQFVVLCQQSGLKDRIINTDLRLDGLERWRRQVENRLGVLGGVIDDQAGVPPQDLDAFVVVDHGGDAFFDDEDYNIPRIVEAEVNEVPLAGGDANAPPGPLFHFHEAPPPAAAPQQPLDGEALAGQMKHFTEQLVQALRQDMRQGFAGVRETLDRHTMTLDRHTATLDLHAVTLANISEASRKRERAPNSTISFCHIAPATTSPHPLWSRAPSQTPLVHKTWRSFWSTTTGTFNRRLRKRRVFNNCVIILGWSILKCAALHTRSRMRNTFGFACAANREHSILSRRNGDDMERGARVDEYYTL
jgi:hypothetical protein